MKHKNSASPLFHLEKACATRFEAGKRARRAREHSSFMFIALLSLILATDDKADKMTLPLVEVGSCCVEYGNGACCPGNRELLSIVVKFMA